MKPQKEFYKPATTLKQVAWNALLKCTEKWQFHSELASKAEFYQMPTVATIQRIKVLDWKQRAQRINDRWKVAVL